MNNNLLTSVFMRLRSALKAKAKLILGNDEDANDALQEAFCRLWAANTAAKDEPHTEGTVMATVRNVSIDMIRRNLVHPVTEIGHTLYTECDADDQEDAEAIYNTVYELINKWLSVRDRDILNKREMYGYDYDELAELYDTTPENVRAIVSRSRRLIRDKYRQTRANPKKSNTPKTD